MNENWKNKYVTTRGCDSVPRTVMLTLQSKYRFIDLRRYGFEFASVDLDKGELILKHPGVNMQDFDMDKQPQIWVMMGWTVNARYFAHSHVIDKDTGRRFQDYIELTQDRLLFIRAAEFEFTKAMYDNSIDKRPLLMKVFGGHIGRTSFTTCVEVKAKSGELLLTNTYQLTGVDLNSRKPIPLSHFTFHWFRERQSSFFKMEPLRFDKFERPAHVRHKKMRVHWSDIDTNIHATWHTYIIMTINSASLLLREGIVRHFRENKSNGLQKLELHFYGESLEGDELEVYIREDFNKTNVMKSDICEKWCNDISSIVSVF